MGIWNAIQNRIMKKPSSLPAVYQASAQSFDRGADGGGMVARLTEDNPFTGFGYVHRNDVGINTYSSLTEDKLGTMPVHEIRRIMARSAPSVSQALTNYQKYCNAGYTILPEAHPLIDGLMDSMVNTDGGFKSFVNSLLDSFFLHGACFFETVYDEQMMPKRMVALDPYSAVYRRSENELGQYYELGQWQPFRVGGSFTHTGGGIFKSLHEDPTIEYLPLYASANDPYGRSFVDSALFHLIMVVGFFKAYKDVLSALVWPNLLLNVDRKVLQEEVKDPTQRQALVNSILAKLKEELKKLKPGSVLAYGSEVKVGGLMSGMNNANLGGVEDFVNILQKEIIRGLETNQLLNALNDNVTETRARYEMADFAKLISHTQSTINEAISRQFNLAFRMNGINETAIFTLNRSIYEEDRLNAEILKTVEDANKAGDDAKMSLLGWLEKAVMDNRMTAPQANAYFQTELERRDNYRATQMLN